MKFHEDEKLCSVSSSLSKAASSSFIVQLYFRGGPGHAQSILTVVNRHNPENMDFRAEGPIKCCNPQKFPPAAGRI